MNFLKELFKIDNLSIIMIVLILIVGSSVLIFSARYLKGDKNLKRYNLNILILITSIILLVCSNNFIVFLFFWFLANYILTELIGHNKVWLAAKNSANLAKKYFLVNFIILSIALSIIYFENQFDNNAQLYLVISCIIVAAFIQSSIWPFQDWLTNSLNAPTPVSAIMHAGLVNGGGFLLVKFSFILVNYQYAMNIIFLFGMITLFIGTIWKLLQSDVKRMLAFSTMAQMGFMIAQCGLGLFPAAISHLFFHGLFKAYLFLSSNSAANIKQFNLEVPTLSEFIQSLFIGIMGGVVFTYVIERDLLVFDSSVFLVLAAVITSTQFALILRQSRKEFSFIVTLIIISVVCYIYGTNVKFIESVLEPDYLSHPLKIGIIHEIAIFFMIASWLTFIFAKKSTLKIEFLMKLYVRALNSSQPSYKTITPNRNKYQI